MERVAFLLVMLIIPHIPSMAQPTWQLTKVKQGIQIYTRDVGNRGFKEFKTFTTFTGVSIHQVFATFRDISAATEWIQNLKTATKLRELSLVEYINYYEIDVPWPLRNRDVCFHIKAHYDSTQQALYIRAMVDTAQVPVKQSLVRIQDAHGFWKFTVLGEQTIAVENQFFADPVGFPSWLVNFFATDGPLQSVKNLNGQVRKDKYKGKHFAFIQ